MSRSTSSRANTSQDVTLPALPELFDPNFLDVLLPPPTLPVGAVNDADKKLADDVTPRNAMMDALRTTVSRTQTDNNADAYEPRAVLSPVLYLFQLLQNYTVSSPSLSRALDDAYKDDPELTLRVIWNARSIHEGKSARDPFYVAFAWLFDRHPRTAIRNLRKLVEPTCPAPPRKRKAKDGENDEAMAAEQDQEGRAHGYWKDLLNIVALAALDQMHKAPDAPFLHHVRSDFTYGAKKWKWRTLDKDDRRVLIEHHAVAAKREAREKRVAARAEARKRLGCKLQEPSFRALFIAVARMFADALLKDIRAVEADPDARISLAGKWAPTPGESHDRVTNIATAIAALLYHEQVLMPLPKLAAPFQTADALPAEQAHIFRSFFQRWILTPLRAAGRVTEPLMSSNRWKEINYARVPSVCMKINMDKFFEHDPKGFEAYLTSVESGKRGISGATLLPHEIVREAMRVGGDLIDEDAKDVKKKRAEIRVRVIEAQWRTLVDRMRESGALDNALAVCDVSGSMGSIFLEGRGRRVYPIFPAVSLSLLLAQVARPPFNNGFITFSEKPEFIQLDPSKGLVRCVDEMVGTNWSMNTDFNAVFTKLLLPLAVKNGVKKEDMVKRLFVFSDMQFDESQRPSADYYGYRNAGHESSTRDWETGHDAVAKAYAKAGYEVPEIVYWNLAAEPRAIPVTGERKGVALMSGFSPGLLKVFMGEADPEAAEVVEGAKAETAEGEDGEWMDVQGDKAAEESGSEDEFTPEAVMRKALLRKSFDGLVVDD